MHKGTRKDDARGPQQCGFSWDSRKNGQGNEQSTSARSGRVGQKTPLDVMQKILPGSLGQVKESR